MTLEELQAKRTELLQRAGIARQTFGDRSVEFSDLEKALLVIDTEIRAAQAAAAPTGSTNTWRGTLATFRND